MEQQIEYYDVLWDIYSHKDHSLKIAYRQMRELLERLCRECMQNESLQMTDLAAKINYLSVKYQFDVIEQNRLHTFRLTSNDILNGRKEGEQGDFLRDLKSISFAVRKIYEQDIPIKLYSVLPRHTVFIPQIKQKIEYIKRMRVCFQYADDSFLYVTPSETVSDNFLHIRYNVENLNEVFKGTIAKLWKYAQLNLLDVAVDEEDVYTPALIVLEPDYLIDISTLAECFKDYGCHPANYNLNKLVPISNSRPLLLGNIVNLFLDEWIHAEDEVNYLACMKKAFKSYPIEIAACEDLLDKVKEFQFFEDCKMHFEHIREIVTKTFNEPGYELNKRDAVLEPSYICEALGIQGRLDYMQRDMTSFIEMKSGKADEYTMRGKVEPKENNKVQMLLYMAVLEYNMGQNHKGMHPYLLYTRYPLLYPARPSWSLVKKAVNLRNLIVANEYNIQLHNNKEYTADKLKEINPHVLNENHLSGKFWEQYLSPSIEIYQKNFSMLSELEKAYFYALYNFITKEQYTSKSGDVDYERKTGTATLWLSTFAEKCEAGEILYDLEIIENHSADRHKAFVTLSIPTYKEDLLPNFRQGDVVVLYERNSEEDLVINKLVFKGSIESISANKIKIRIRATQKNTSVFNEDSFYAIEHDVMDTSFRCMFQGLYSFVTANKERRELLLSQRLPRFDCSLETKIAATHNDFERIALKTLAAKDYFLLVGPPGTGKTSCALKRIVETFYSDVENQILLLSYTNRAVDEICKSLLSINPKVDFIRIGSELSCDEPYREYLIENKLALCNCRSEVNKCVSSCRIFVGTVASIANKPELFKLKTFQVAIVDEATQILEPQILGILCARNRKGENAIQKFILIGDHKQLPAVVLQNEEQSRVSDKDLNNIGLFNLKDSLFERLYRFHSGHADPRIMDMLCRQGRMNPTIALYPNNAFYGGKLEIVGLPHQTEVWTLPSDPIDNLWNKIMSHRLVFIPSSVQKNGTSVKTNIEEARIVSRITKKIYDKYKKTFDVTRTLGIITPYRSQIALIRKEISQLAIPELNDITIDTVERYQGSERDIIIYSFSINYSYQLRFLSNLMEENGMMIDRKLNVVLTRARKQLFITGVPELLRHNPIYRNLINLITEIGIFTELHNS